LSHYFSHIFSEQLLYLKFQREVNYPMLSLEHNTSEDSYDDQKIELYDRVLDSGLKIIEDERDSNTHRYTVELGYRSENSELHLGQVTFLESEKATEPSALVRGDEDALDTVLDRLNGDFELEDRKGSQYISY